VYSTCLFCSGSLGANDVIEALPVGRRLAFDAARGRLWVVCRRCERWNLTPIEERWEAIESCERLFRDTRLRVSTDNIGLARVSEGLELVRIGAALRPEFAAWRYGDQFGRRRRRHLVLTGAGVAAGVGIIIAGPVMGLVAGSSWALMNVANTVHNVLEARRIRVRLRVPGRAQALPLRRRELQAASLVADEGGAGWALRVPVAGDEGTRFLPRPGLSSLSVPNDTTITLAGRGALDAAGQLLPHLNAAGARRGAVQAAVQLIEAAGEPERLFADLASRVDASLESDAARIHAQPIEVRLALEMAAHEEAERRAMSGELALLAAAWREAEEIAAIADQLLVPSDIEHRIGGASDRKGQSG
jgi:hypothetical protein